MPVTNSKIAAMFYEMADLLEIEGENQFRVRAYRNAARIISSLSQNLTDLIAEEKDLTEFPGIGKAIAEKIETIVKTGKLPQLQEEEKRVPRVLGELMRLPGLGPKKTKALYDRLKIQSVDDLKKALEKNQVQELPGFGQKTADMIKKGLLHFYEQPQRLRLVDAEAIVTPLLSYLKQKTEIKHLEVAGSYRRRKETVGDIDILATAQKSASVIDHFVAYDEVKEILSKGSTRSTVSLYSGIQVDLRVVPVDCFGAALHYFTGSKAHNITIRKMGVKRKLKINEYGVFKGNKRIAGKAEKEVFEQVGLPFIEPELREDQGEIEAAMKNQLPKLIRLENIRGDLHCHTKATDGRYSLEDMVEAAQKKGYEYVAITDHSQHLSVAKGLDKKRLLEQIKMIDKLNEKLKNFRVLKSIEVDILENGSLDLPNSVLKELDIRVCSVHYKFNLSKKQQTKRILLAMDNPYFNILAHPTGRLINRREPYEVDLEKILQAAKERHCFVEINAQPERLDFNDTYCRMAKEMGVKIAISTDAHHVAELEYMRFGIDQARRGWLEADDVINTRHLSNLLKLLKRN